MQVTVFGVGYVGLVQAVVLANLGNQLVCVDTCQDKVDALNQGQVPIYEPHLEQLLQANIAAGRLRFTTDAELGIKHAEVIFIAVGTPESMHGSADMRYVMQVAETIGQYLDHYAVIVNKSTVPVGTADKVEWVISAGLSKRQIKCQFDVASNPEFLKEGSAIADCSKPDRIILGCDSEKALAVLKQLYLPINRNHERTIIMDRRSAELTKYAANCMLATKISFMNEMANVAEGLGADIEKVRRGIGADPRIGHHFIYPGCGYGGSCFPKDVKALLNSVLEHGYQASLLNAVDQVNQQQKHKLARLVSQYYAQGIRQLNFAVWGLAFKPDTDDMREAPSMTLIRQLLDEGAHIHAYDPIASETAKAALGHYSEGVTFHRDAYQALEQADGLIICTEWKEFKSPDFARIQALLKQAVIFDGRNLYEPQMMQQLNIDYFGIGRGLSINNHQPKPQTEDDCLEAIRAYSFQH